MSYYTSDRSRSSGYDTRSSGYDTRGYSSQSSAARPPKSSYTSGRYDDVTSSMSKLSVGKRPAAAVAPRFDEKQVIKMLKSLRVSAFKVHFPKWDVSSGRQKQQAPQGYPPSSQGYKSSSSSSAYPSSQSAQKVSSKSSSTSKGYKYNCDCGKGFNRDEDISDHLDRHRKHREVRRK